MADEKKQENTGIVEYESNGEIVKISPTTVRKYLVSGGGNVSDQEVMMFMSLCRYQHLNPFLKEAYLIKFGNNDPATIVTGKDVFTKRADANPNYAGKKAGIIVQKKDGSVEEREGSFVLKDESIVGGWAKVFIKGRETPEYQSVSFDEYVGRKKDGSIKDVPFTATGICYKGKMLKERKAKGKPVQWTCGEEVYHWWMQDTNVFGQMQLSDFMELENG